MVDSPVSISRANSQPLIDGVEEAQDHWKRNFVSNLADSLLESGEGGCFPVFVLDALFNAAQKSLIGLPKVMRVGSLGDEGWLLGEQT